MKSMDQKIDDLTILVGELAKYNTRVKSDSIFIKAACTIVTTCSLFVVTNTMDLNKQIASKADAEKVNAALRDKISSTSYYMMENRRAKEILNYIDVTYKLRDEDLRILERNKVEESLSNMIQMVTTRSDK